MTERKHGRTPFHSERVLGIQFRDGAGAAFAGGGFRM